MLKRYLRVACTLVYSPTQQKSTHLSIQAFFDIWVGCGLRVGCVLFANLKNDLPISAIISVRVACELRAELTSYVWVTSQAYHLLFKWNRFIIFISTKFVIEESTWWKLLQKSNKSDLKCNIKTTETAYWSSACELRAEFMKYVHVAFMLRAPRLYCV